MLKRIAILAVLIPLAVPAIARAEEQSSVACVEAQYSSAFPKAPEECAHERQKAAEEQAHAEANPPCSLNEWRFEAEDCTEKAALAAEERAPATFLNVTVRSHRGSFYSAPGWTAIVISTSPYARVTVTGDHGARTFRFQHPEAGGWGEPGPEVLTTYWSCHGRGQTLHFSVQAQGGSGAPLMYSGHFKNTLTARWCAAAKRKERAEGFERRAKVRKEAAEHARRERERHQREVERFETNCRAIGGTPVEIHTSEGNRIVCHSKTGGVIPVPQ